MFKMLCCPFGQHRPLFWSLNESFSVSGEEALPAAGELELPLESQG